MQRYCTDDARSSDEAFGKMPVACSFPIFVQAVGLVIQIAWVVNHPLANDRMQHGVFAWTRNLSPHNGVDLPG